MKTNSRTAIYLLLFAVLLGSASHTVYAAKPVVKKISVESSLSGDKRKVIVAKGKSVKLTTTVKVKPDKKKNKKVIYSVKNKKIATVNKKGVVKGKKAGKTKITVVSSVNKKKKATITVQVMKGAVKEIALNQKDTILPIGESLKLKPIVQAEKGADKTLHYASSDKKVATVSKTGTVKAVGEGKATITAKAIDGSGKKAFFTVTVKEKQPYTYSVTPLLPPFNEYFYVKTDNPDPESFYFLDPESRYRDAQSTARCELRPTVERFLDVEYEDKATGRVKGGYIFKREGVYSDGGMLHLMQMSPGESSYVIITDTGGYFSLVDIHTGNDTGVQVECPEVKSELQYLMDTYTTDTMNFFEKMDAIQSGLDRHALYPKYIRDRSKRNSYFPYPFFAVSPYWELGLNTHYEMYEISEDDLLIENLYPYALDSYGFPSLMVQAARQLDPSCTVQAGAVHYIIVVTKDGITKSYGGAGTGGSDPLYADHAEKLFLFDGTGNDYAANATLELLANKKVEYEAFSVADAQVYQSQMGGDIYNQTVSPSSWIRVGVEGRSLASKAGPKVYAYVTKGEYFNEYPYHATQYGAYSLQNVWVDGRYINELNYFEKGAKFEDYPKADIVIRNMDYVDMKGMEQCGDVRFHYDESSDTWKSTAYTAGYWYDSSTIVYPDEFTLTREEVEALEVDKNRDIDPPAGFIYDGSVEPGTPF
ncbi:MAG: Ig-like domain-containing protein [Clostridium sp.]|nr:Ig-like domain-containing protein [Clostridium sp.]